MREIEIDTDDLRRDTRTLRDYTTRLQSEYKNMFRALEELNAMWEGTARAAFNVEFQKDMETFNQMIRTMNELNQALDHAAQEYDTCDANVQQAINSIRV